MILISHNVQHTIESPTGTVIPGPPARAEPGIQGLFPGRSGFRAALRLPGMTKLNFVANQIDD